MPEQLENPEKSVAAWVERMEEDYRTAQDLLHSGRYTWCAFACQQCLEKYLKAAYVKQFAKVPPYTHSLLRLCKELALVPSEAMLETIARIDKYYLTARYPAYKESVNISSRTVAEEFFQKADEVLQWFKQQQPL